MSVELAKDPNAAKGFAALRAAKLINKNMGIAGFFSTDNTKKLLASRSSWAGSSCGRGWNQLMGHCISQTLIGKTSFISSWYSAPHSLKSTFSA
jgi:hypothetical protein